MLNKITSQKIIKKYGGSNIISITPDESKMLDAKTGDTIKVTFEKENE